MHWRILTVAGIGAIVGAAVSLLALSATGETFYDLWIGGAIGGAVGIVIGVAWHLSSAARRSKSHLLYIGAFLLPAVILSVVAAQMASRSSPEFGFIAFDTPQGEARSFVRSSVGHNLPEGVRAIFSSPNKVQFRLSPAVLDSMESVVGLDSTWDAADWGCGTGYTRVDTTNTGVHEQLYQRCNQFYSVTRFR